MNPYWEDASGTFSYDRWKAAIDKASESAGHGLIHAVNDGVAFGHYIINEPFQPSADDVFYCELCHEFYRPRYCPQPGVSVSCCVLHAPGDCCHFLDDQLNRDDPAVIAFMAHERENEAKIARLQRRERRRAHLRRLIPWIPLALALLAWTAVAHAQTPAPDTVRIGPTTAVIYIVDLKAPPEYARWYHEAERCVSAIAPAGPWYAPHRTLRGRYAAVRWFQTSAPWRDGLHGGMSTLAAWQPGHRITISAPYLADSAIVLHESIHDILAWNGLNDENDPHAKPWFDGRCAKAAYP